MLLKNTRMLRCRSMASHLDFFEQPARTIFQHSLGIPPNSCACPACLHHLGVLRLSSPIYLGSVSRAIDASRTADRMISGA
jgi:hypothetical protein